MNKTKIMYPFYTSRHQHYQGNFLQIATVLQRPIKTPRFLDQASSPHHAITTNRGPFVLCPKFSLSTPQNPGTLDQNHSHHQAGNWSKPIPLSP